MKDMPMPHSRRNTLVLVAGVLFTANVLGLFFALRAAYTSLPDTSSAQFAGSTIPIADDNNMRASSTADELPMED